MPEIKAPPIYRMVLYRRFDVDDAKFHERYFLEKSVITGIFRKHREWRPVTIPRGNGWDSWDTPASGNEDWAKRIMREFHIDGVTVL